MQEKEFRKLTRRELLEMLLEQSKEVKALREELEETKAELQNARGRLDEHRLELTNAGSIAEAALQLSGVFEAAQAAADTYIENLRRLSRETEEERAFRHESQKRRREEQGL